MGCHIPSKMQKLEGREREKEKKLRIGERDLFI
jgi:hypothetical protein